MDEKILKHCPMCAADGLETLMIKVDDHWYCTACNYSEADREDDGKNKK